ncbi:MAG: 3Fe-4S ferredoxin [Streptosporangiaceae bacterium]|jgi:ferredoxin|nr:3Fe-4S ferredoxin [Streptosporangiaceae bacterium]
MRIIVDRTRCIGLGMCQSVAADVFQVNDDGEMELRTAIVTDGRLAEVERAVACCPNEALGLAP